MRGLFKLGAKMFGGFCPVAFGGFRSAEGGGGGGDRSRMWIAAPLVLELGSGTGRNRRSKAG